MQKWECGVCGYIYEGELPVDFVCPKCGVPGGVFSQQKTGASLSKFAGTKTEQNLKKAYAGESQVRNKYSFYASKASSDGFEAIAAIFRMVADNEQAHAKLWMKELDGIGTTAQNLFSAAEGEKYEWSEMYNEFADTALDEGFDKTAELFRAVGKIEKQHEEEFRKLLKEVNGEKVFERTSEVDWRCMVCGHIANGKLAPAKCPVCGHEQAFFEEKRSV